MVLTRQVMEVVEEEEGEREAGLLTQTESGLLTQTVSVELRIGWVKRME